MTIFMRTLVIIGQRGAFPSGKGQGVNCPPPPYSGTPDTTKASLTLTNIKSVWFHGSPRGVAPYFALSDGR